MSRSVVFPVVARACVPVVALLLLAGCLGPSDAPSPRGPSDADLGDPAPSDAARNGTAPPPDSPCAPEDPASFSGNAPRLAAFRGEPEDVLRRIAGFVGAQPVSDHGSVDEGSNTFLLDVARGRMSMRLDGSGLVQWWEDRVWPALDPAEAERVVREYLDATGAADVGVWEVSTSTDAARNATTVTVEARSGAVAVQEFHATTERYYGERVSASIGPLHDLAAAEAALSSEDAATIADERAACVGESSPTTAVRRFAVWNDSLVYVVAPNGTQAVTYADGSTVHGCPPPWTAYVDAATGAVHAFETALCI